MRDRIKLKDYSLISPVAYNVSGTVWGHGDTDVNKRSTNLYPSWGFYSHGER